MLIFLVLLAIVIGSLMPIQAGLNAELGRIVQNPFVGALISFTTGTIALGLIVLFQGSIIEYARRLPFHAPHLLMGGFLGAIFVGASIFLIPKLGATTMIGAFVTGQLLMSLIIDHYGFLGMPVNPISLQRIMGVILLFAGLLLVIRKTA